MRRLALWEVREVEQQQAQERQEEGREGREERRSDDGERKRETDFDVEGVAFDGCNAAETSAPTLAPSQLSIK